MLYLILAVGAVILAVALFTLVSTRRIGRRYANIGTIHNVDGQLINALHIPAGPGAKLPPVVFIHGASANLRDQALAFRAALEGRAELLFVDRPGHGYSPRGAARHGFPDGQADTIAALMAHLKLGPAIVVGHSFGGAVAASLAVLHPQQVAGLLLLSPASHPWPGGVALHNHIAALTGIGPLFCRLVPLPVGLLLLEGIVRFVFSPAPVPPGYNEAAAIPLVLRPRTFRANAVDLVNVNDYFRRFAPRYSEIVAPTIVITGDSDNVVSPAIHAQALAREIPGARLITVPAIGHKPDYSANAVCVAAIEELGAAGTAGRPTTRDDASREKA